MFTLATGIKMSASDMINVGERVRNLERAIMVREGRSRENDTLGDSYFTLPIKNFPVPGPDGFFVPQTRKIDRKKLEKLKDHYYIERGWDIDTGIPTKNKLCELDLSEVANILWEKLSNS